MGIHNDGDAKNRHVKINWNAKKISVAANMWVNSQWRSSNVFKSPNNKWSKDLKWPADKDIAWACGQAQTAPRIVQMYDSSLCIFGKYLVNPPPQTSKIQQEIAYSHLSVTTYTGAVKATYETGYGVAIGIYDKKTGYKQGCSVSSTATAGRRSGVKVKYSAVVVEKEVAAASKA